MSNPGRVSPIMMHHTDWGPTLVSAAGGDGGALTRNATLRLDGHDQWGALSLQPGLNHTAPRTEMLVGHLCCVVLRPTGSQTMFGLSQKPLFDVG